MHQKRRFKRSAAAFLAVTQCAMPVFAATAGIWEVKDGNWIYKGEDGKYLSDTWLRTPSDGRLYHLDADGVMDSGWLLKDGTWYFLTTEHNGFFGAALENTWAWVDGYCYYFGADGKMAASCTTPDGFTVNGEGQWTENGTAVYVAGRGYQTKPVPAMEAVSMVKTSGGGGGGRSYSGGGSGLFQDGKDQDDGAQKDSKPLEGEGGDKADTLYVYTVRYTDTEGNLLASYERKALRDSIITADERKFSGYRKQDTGLALFHLTMDHAVFAVVYEKEMADSQDGNNENQDSRDTFSYQIRYVDEGGSVLFQENGKGMPGSDVHIHEKSFDGYKKKGDQADIRVLNKDNEVFDVIYIKEEVSEQYSYIVRYIGPKGEVLSEEFGTGKPGSTVQVKAYGFDGYQFVGDQKTSAALEMDGQVFTLYYVNLDNGKDTGKEEDTSCIYTIYHVGTDGRVLHTTSGEGKAGDKITIEPMQFDGYQEKKGQAHEKNLSAGQVTFTVLYHADGKNLCGYTVRYAAMDGTLLYEETNEALLGDEAEIQSKEFEGYQEIENQSHTVMVLSDGAIFYIKYEAVREEDLPNQGREPEGSEEKDPGAEEKNPVTDNNVIVL